MRIAMTGIGAGGSVQIVQSLRDGLNDVFIVGLDADKFAVGRFFVDKFHVLPMAYANDYIDKLYQVCQGEKIDVAIISVDEEIIKLTGYKEKFHSIGTKLTIANPKSVLNCFDKWSLYNSIIKIDTNIPDTYRIHNFNFKKGRNYIIKPRFGRGSRGIHYLSSETELLYLNKITNLEDHLVQERIYGKEYTVDILRNRNGEYAAIVPRLRLSTESGLSIRGITEKRNDLIKKSKEVMEYLDLWGAVNIQWIINEETNTPYLIEVNPRLAGSVVLSVAAGVNIPAELIKIFYDEEYQAVYQDFHEGVSMYRYWQAIFENPFKGA